MIIREKCILGMQIARHKARWVWRHRTKTAGSLAMVAGGCQGFIEGHPGLAKMLPGSQAMLIGFGAVVAGIGFYNTVAGWFGWKDDPDPPDVPRGT